MSGRYSDRGGGGGAGRAPPDVGGMYSLKVDNISYNTTINELQRLFDRYGEIGDIHVPRDRYTRQSKGFAFVRFHSRRDAEDAMDALDGRRIDGREVRVQFAKYDRPIDERERRGGGGGGGGGGRRRSRSRSRSRSPPPRRDSRGGDRDEGRRAADSRSRSRTRSRTPRDNASPGRSRSKSPVGDRNGRARADSGSKSPE